MLGNLGFFCSLCVLFSRCLCGKSDFPYHKELLLKERFYSLWEQILSFNFEKGRNDREPLLDPVYIQSPFDVRKLYLKNFSGVEQF